MILSKSIYDVFYWGSGAVAIGPLILLGLFLRFRWAPSRALLVPALLVMLPMGLFFGYLNVGATKVVVLHEHDGKMSVERGYQLGVDLHWHDHTRLENKSQRPVVVVEVAYVDSPGKDPDAEPPNWTVSPGDTFALAHDIGYLGPDDEPPDSLTVDESSSSETRYWVTW